MINRYKHFVYFAILTIMAGTLYSQSLQELQKMKRDYENLKNFPQNEKVGSNTFNESEGNFDIDRRVDIIPYKDLGESVDSVSNEKYFGYDFLTRRDTVSFFENLPTPSSYIIGPGDELIISLWGQTQIRQKYIVSRNGDIYDEKVGLLNVSGKTVIENERYLKNQFSRVYSTLKGSNPTSLIDVSIGKLRSINVNFVGEVKYPGVYTVHPYTNAINGLIQCGGVNTTGSLRNIQIKRDGKLFKAIDLYEYFLLGNDPKNIQLRDQDIVLVPTRLSTIYIDSAVYRPGYFELFKNETLNNLVFYAGGVKPNASKNISIERIIPLNERVSNSIPYRNFYIDLTKNEKFILLDGDKLIVQNIFETIQKVEIIGQVKNPGIYNYYNDMRVRDLLVLAGGLEDEDFWKSVYQKQGEIVRRNPNTRYESVLNINIEDMINGVNDQNILLQNFDRFVVHANRNYFENKTIQVVGEVNIPGSYSLISENESLNDIISRAGGLTTLALENGVSVFRNKKYFQTVEINKARENEKISNIIESTSSDEMLRLAWSNQDITVMPGDSIVVKESTGTVNIIGQVYNPGIIEYKKNKPLRYYLNAAGGVSQNADKNAIIIVYANGVVSPNRWYRSPKIEDGSTIIVNSKEFQEPFDITQFATNWTSIISSMVTAIVLSQQISRN